jgi:hypothetical protein
MQGELSVSGIQFNEGAIGGALIPDSSIDRYMKSLLLVNKLLKGNALCPEDLLASEEWGLPFACDTGINQPDSLAFFFLNRFKAGRRYCHHRDVRLLPTNQWQLALEGLPAALTQSLLLYLEEELETFQVLASAFLGYVEGIPYSPIYLSLSTAVGSNDNPTAEEKEKAIDCYSKQCEAVAALLQKAHPPKVDNAAGSLDEGEVQEEEQLQQIKIAAQKMFWGYLMQLPDNDVFRNKTVEDASKMRAHLAPLVDCAMPESIRNGLVVLLDNMPETGE